MAWVSSYSHMKCGCRSRSTSRAVGVMVSFFESGSTATLYGASFLCRRSTVRFSPFTSSSS